jgi:hypothetical protein
MEEGRVVVQNNLLHDVQLDIQNDVQLDES